MIRSNYHVHSNYCDGKNSLEEMVLAGIDAGLTSMGLSSHMPLPFKNDWTMRESSLDNYFKEVTYLKEKYSLSIELYCGLEIDYFIDQNDISPLSKKNISKLDFTIMSIHTIGSTRSDNVYYIDETQNNFAQGIKKFYKNKPRDFIEDYYHSIAQMVLDYQPDILGHLDLIKKFNPEHFFFDEKDNWYKDSVIECLDAISETGTLVEINTGANLRVPGVGRYPSDWIIPELFKRKIPITISGDSHTVTGINYDFSKTEIFLMDCGYKEYGMLKKGRWEMQPLGI
ncbi:MAG: histidinol-phosphatase [Eubacteriaceae bacterium]|nr:histidinol-phosphatase [Eubacteriaceae bacterium]